MEQYYTIKEVAEMLKVTELTVKRWIYDDGKMKAVKLGDYGQRTPIRVSESELKKIIKPIER